MRFKWMEGHNLRELTTENPMLVEVTRFRRKYFTLSGINSPNLAAALIFVVCFVGLTLLVVSMRGSIPPVAIIYLQTSLFGIFIPAILYQSVAGEREKRTWDLLLVAPISKAQIVVGKFMASSAALFSVTGLLLVPTIFAGVNYDRWSLFHVLQEEVVSLSFGVLMCAVTIFFSARAKRPLVALATSGGFSLCALVIFPSLIGVLSSSDQILTAFCLYLHPIAAIERIESQSNNAYDPLAGAVYGLPQVFTYLLLTAIVLAWATNTLVFAENEVRFLPKNKTHA
jgi:ABC-type transport system involved in multi-copper enzyme maturation permease subunit